MLDRLSKERVGVSIPEGGERSRKLKGITLVELVGSERFSSTLFELIELVKNVSLDLCRAGGRK